MHKIKIIDLLASICLFIGSIINIIEIFVELHILFSVIATVFILISLVLWFIVYRQSKSNKQ